MQLNKDDAWGCAAAAVATTGPLLALTCFADTTSKDGPIGFPAYTLPAAVGFVAAFLGSAAATAVGRRRTNRFWLHGEFGLMAGLLLAVSYFGWMNWWFGCAQRFAG